MKAHPKYKFSIGEHVTFKNKYGRVFSGFITECIISILNYKSGTYAITYRIRVEGNTYDRLIEESLLEKQEGDAK